MKIKENLLIILFLTIGTLGNAQDYKKNIESGFIEYLNTITNMEFEKSMEYITPKLFEIVPKSQMIQAMEQTFKNPRMKLEIKNTKILNVNDSEKIENAYYSLLTYSNQMNMRIDGEKGESEDEKKTRINQTKLSFEKAFGAENVMYNETTGFFEIQSQKQAYGISENGETNWKFLVIEKQQKAILDRILPKVLAEKI